MWKDSEKPYKERHKESGIIDSLTEENAVQAIVDGVQDDIDGLQGIDKDYLKTRISETIKDYETENGIDLFSMRQLVWNDVLQTIADRIIKPMQIDIRDIDIITGLCDTYISICHRYNKSTSVYGFSIMSCIPYNVLRHSSNTDNYYTYIDIDNNYREINSKSIVLYRNSPKYINNHIIKVSNNVYYEIVKKISSDREHCLTDKTEDGSIPSLALGKIEFGWIESAKEKIQVEHYEKYRLPTDIIKELTDN